jgi:aryl-alcohol dehydrogenase-like predicted oxidoreductase
MYPVPTKPETQGQTDRSVAMFLKTRKRDEIVLATKVCGRSERFTWLPRRQSGISTAVTPEQIVDSVEASLTRLGTDYIDLLQIHWPGTQTDNVQMLEEEGQLATGTSRTHLSFVLRSDQPDFLPSAYEASPSPTSFREQLEGLQKVVQSGKVRYVGLSNESPYGLCSFVHLAQQYPDLYPKIVSIQNSCT